MKKFLIILGVVLAGALAYYLLSPLFIQTTLVEEIPEAFSPDVNTQQAQTEIPVADVTEDFPAIEEWVLADDALVSSKRYVLPDATPVRGPFAVSGTASHSASGNVYVLTNDTQQIIRYEDFSTVNGPRLRVYLSNDLEASEYVDIGALKATNGDMNYQLPEGVDARQWQYVLVWCEPFGVLFNYALLQ